MEISRKGIMTVPHHVTTSKVFICSMVRTRGGAVAKPVAPPRIYLQPNGVKVRKVDGGYRYQPPSLKFITNRIMDKIEPHGPPNGNLYQSVQRVIDRLVDFVENKMMGLEYAGINIYFKLCSNWFQVASIFD